MNTGNPMADKSSSKKSIYKIAEDHSLLVS